MSKTDHDVLSVGTIHGVVNLEYADAAAREGATGLEAKNLYDVAKQSDDNSIWILLQVSPDLIWKRLDPGPFGTTIQDMDIYIDGSTGNDETGDGSATNPYKTFTKACSVIPFEVRHEVRIFPTAGTYPESSLDIIHRPIGNGRIIVDASGETYPVTAGPFTVASVSGVGAVGPYAVEMATDLQVSGSPGWSADQYYGKFIHVLTGNWAGYILPIFKNVSDTMRTYPDWYTFIPGDTFNIVDCPVQINVDNGVYIKGDSTLLTDWLGDEIESPVKPWFLMCGVKIRANITRQKSFPFKIEKAVTVFSFCSLIDIDSNTVPLECRDFSLNNRNIPSNTFSNSNLTDWYVYALHVAQADGVPPASSHRDIEASGGEIGPIACRGSIAFLGFGLAGGLILNFNLCGGISGFKTGDLIVDYLFIEQISFSGPCIDLENPVFLRSSSIYIENGGLFINADNRSYILALWLKGNTTTEQYALEIKSGAYFVRESVSNVDILGTVGAVKFIFDGSTHAAWPLTGVVVNDSAGSWVKTS